MTTAKTRDQYVTAWKSHVAQLGSVAFDADRDVTNGTPGYTILKQIEALTDQLIELAAAANYAE